MINVLVFPAGEINSVELHDALATCVNVTVWGASSIERHGSYVFENYVPGLPLITAPDFLEKFNKLLTEKQIDVIFPTHDTVAKFLAENLHQIRAKVICSAPKTAEICRDKEKTYQALAGADFLPETYPELSHFSCLYQTQRGARQCGRQTGQITGRRGGYHIK